MKLLKKLATLSLVMLLTLNYSCREEDPPQAACHSGISYKLDGTAKSFADNTVTAEIHNDAAIGKFYDIWTDANGGFYFHSTITETNETAPYAREWFTTDDVANIIFLNAKTNVNMTFKIEEGADAVNDNVKITFSGSYEENGMVHQITDGLICTTIDIVQ